MSNTGKHTYGQILKSSALIGSSSVINIVMGIVRTKAMAVLIGPAGIGLLGLYGSISDLARSIAGMGINSSGVRQIAEAVGTGDTHRIARTVTTLRRVALVLGALGAILLLVLSKPVSRLTFEDDQHADSVALLSLAVLFGAISAGQGALVQGMRRISDLARMSVLGAFYGTLFSIPVVYFYGERGVAFSLVCVGAMGIVTSWWYSRKIKVEHVALSLGQILRESAELLKLGLVFMVTGLVTLGAAYLVRLIVTREIGVEAAGFYQAAWALGGLYVGFILQAMGADFYPRLTAAANDDSECNRLVNEQAEVSLLLASAGVLATLTFAPLVIRIFYSARFEPAVEILRWICLGMMLRVVTWPLGFILLARGKRGFFFWTEFLGSLVQVGLVWVCVRVFGLEGAGIAFFGFYALYLCAIYTIVRSVSGFRWSAANKRAGLLFLPLVAAVFGGWYVLPRIALVALGATVTAAAGIYSLRTMCALVPVERFPRSVRRTLGILRLIRPTGNRCARS